MVVVLQLQECACSSSHVGFASELLTHFVSVIPASQPHRESDIMKLRRAAFLPLFASQGNVACKNELIEVH